MQGKISTAARLALSFALALALGGCFKKESNVKLKVAVKTNHGEPVAGAIVAVDGKPVGETNETGELAAEVKLPAGGRCRLEVKKDSEDYYFAPYYESFPVEEEQMQSVTMAATLYFVPKPAGDKPAEQPVAEAPKVQVPAVPEAVTEPAAVTEPVAEPVAEVATTPTDTADLAAAIEEPKAEEPKTNAPKVEEPKAEEVAVEPPTDDEIAEADALESKTTASVPKTTEPATLPLDFTPSALKPSSYPKPTRPNAGQTVFTLHVYAGGQPLGEADVLLGHDEDGDLKVACTTNARGRCVVRFPVPPPLPVTFVATKTGYRTKSTTVAIKNQSTLRFDLDKGQTLDVYAITKTYGFAVGLKDVEVYVGGKRVGETDKFGRYSHVYTGKPDDLMTITLKTRGHLPETYETDFVASGPMRLVKHFTPIEAPAVRLSVLDVRPAGTVDDKIAKQLASATDAVRTASRKHVFASAAFKEYQPALLEKSLARAARTSSDILRAGWADTDLKGVVDAVLLPTVVAGAEPALELSIIDSHARVLAAAREPLEGGVDPASVDRAVSVLAKKIARVFPFEGAVLSKEADKVVLNLGYAAGRGMKAGDQLEVWGVQSGKTGQSQEHGRIGILTVREVFDQTSKAAVTKLVPRAVIERGDLVALRPRRAPEGGGGPQIRVVGNAQGVKQTPVAQANIYFNDQWIGATDGTGRLYLDATGSGTIRVIRHGYKDHSQAVVLGAASRLDVGLRRETAFLRVDSRPTQATVKVDGKVIGKTPLAAPVPVPAGFVKLEIEVGGSYKTYSQVLELDQGTLDLTGANAVALEADLCAVARRLAKNGDNDRALAAYAEIPKTHSDYLLGRHEAGELLLTVLDRPAEAAAAFAEVTSTEAVKDFTDKRFIGSHVNEGVALFLTAEKLGDGRGEEARAHYRKAIEVFDRVIPYLRFVPAEQYTQAVHNVDYHRALARHKLSVATQDQALLAETVKTWRTYLDGSARSVPADDASKTYVENAEVYLKQAVASLDAARSTSRQ